MRGRRIAVAAVVLASLAVSAGLAVSYSRRLGVPRVVQWTEDLRTRTVPSGAGSLRISGLQVNGSTTTTTWTFETNWTWSEYRRWVSTQLGGDFQSLPADGDVANFNRELTGDANFVSVVAVRQGPPLKVRIMFTSTPD